MTTEEKLDKAEELLATKPRACDFIEPHMQRMVEAIRLAAEALVELGRAMQSLKKDLEDIRDRQRG